MRALTPIKDPVDRQIVCGFVSAFAARARKSCTSPQIVRKLSDVSIVGIMTCLQRVERLLR